MDGNDQGEEPSQDDFFKRRLLLAIESWDANLHLGTMPSFDRRGRHNGRELLYSRGFDLQCRALAPFKRRGEPVRTHMMLIEPKYLLRPSRAMGFGQFHTTCENPDLPPLSINLYMHEQDLAYIATCLASVWKYLHVWISDEDDRGANVTDYSFSADLAPRIQARICE